MALPRFRAVALWMMVLLAFQNSDEFVNLSAIGGIQHVVLLS